MLLTKAMIIMAEAEVTIEEENTMEVEDTLEEDITMAVVAKEEVEDMIMAVVDVEELPILDTPATIMATTMGIGSIIQLLQYNTFVQLHQNNIIRYQQIMLSNLWYDNVALNMGNVMDTGKSTSVENDTIDFDHGMQDMIGM